MGTTIIAGRLIVSYHSYIQVKQYGHESHMPNKITQKTPKNTSRLFKNLSAYVIEREKSLRELASAQKDNKSSVDLSALERLKTERSSQLDVQVLFNVLELLVKNMNQEDVRVQLALAKLYELKAAVLVSSMK